MTVGVGRRIRAVDAVIGSAPGRRWSGLPACRRPGSRAGAASASAPRHHAGQRDEFAGHAVAEGDGAGLVEQQRIDVARRLDGAAGGGEHVEADQPVHAGDADGRQQAADGGGDQPDQQRHQHGDRECRAGIAAEAHSVTTAIRKIRVRPRAGSKRELIGRLAALGAFHQRDHAVEEGRARLGGDADHDPVGHHLVPPVTAQRSPPASRITGADSPVMAHSLTLATPSMIRHRRE